MGVVGYWDTGPSRLSGGTGPTTPPGFYGARTPTRRRTLLHFVGVLATIAGLVAATGCGSSGPPPDRAGIPSTTSGSTMVRSSTTSSASASTTVPNVVNLRKNVFMATCGAVAGGWAAGGSAVSAGNKTTSYTITIYFVTNPGDTVEASGVTHVTVDPGKSAAWQVVAHFPVSSGIQCVLRGVS